MSTATGGLETPDFLELRKNANRAAPEPEPSSRSLYQVVQEKQTAVRGVMGSERGYDLSGISGSNVPVLGDERGTKVSWLNRVEASDGSRLYVAESRWC
jgi:splicing factor 3B subunit 2